MAAAPDGETMAVLLALAGPRTDDPVCVVAPDHPLAVRLRAGLLAMSRTDVEAETDAQVCVAGGSEDLAEAVRRTALGGKIVSLAADRRTVAHDVASYDLVLLHVEPLPTGGLVFAARLTASTPPGS